MSAEKNPRIFSVHKAVTTKATEAHFLAQESKVGSIFANLPMGI